MPIDKQQLLQRSIRQLESEIARLRGSYEEARQTSVDSPGRMQSRYDTMGVEAAWVADGLSRNLDAMRAALGRLKAMRLPDEPKRGLLGALISVGSEDGLVEARYFILPGCGGLEFREEDAVIRVVTPGSPVGCQLIGKEIGDEVAVPPTAKQPSVIIAID